MLNRSQLYVKGWDSAGSWVITALADSLHEAATIAADLWSDRGAYEPEAAAHSVTITDTNGHAMIEIADDGQAQQFPHHRYSPEELDHATTTARNLLDYSRHADAQIAEMMAS
jgi:hypothetical protein